MLDDGWLSVGVPVDAVDEELDVVVLDEVFDVVEDAELDDAELLDDAALDVSDEAFELLDEELP